MNILFLIAFILLLAAELGLLALARSGRIRLQNGYSSALFAYGWKSALIIKALFLAAGAWEILAREARPWTDNTLLDIQAVTVLLGLDCWRQSRKRQAQNTGPGHDHK